MKCGVSLITLVVAGIVGAADSPNVVYILADDMGYGDVRALNPDCQFPTPYLDKLAADGMTFTDAHTNSSCCTPTRYGIMTGRYAWRTSLKSGVLSGYSRLMIDTKRTTVASLLKRQGYRTACIGKWHMGITWPTVDGKAVKSRATGPNVDYLSDITGGPLDVGFDYYFGLAGSLGMPPHGYLENRRLIGELGAVVKGKMKDKGTPFFQCRPGQSVKGFDVHKVLREVTERAVEYIADQDQPFFLYLAFNSPHSPVAPILNGLARAASIRMPTLSWRRIGRLVRSLRGWTGQGRATTRSSFLLRTMGAAKRPASTYWPTPGTAPGIFTAA